MKIMIAEIEGTPEECTKLIELLKIESIEDLTKAIREGIEKGKVSFG